MLTSTTTAVPSATDFPNNTGKFEKRGVQTHQYAPSWSPWTFQFLLYGIPQTGGSWFMRGSGIAKDDAPLLAQSNPAPQGEKVAFLHGRGTATCSKTFQPGWWRLRFFAAPRLQGTVADSQGIRITVGGVNVFEQQITDGTFREYVTDPIYFATAQSKQVKFAGTADQDEIVLFDRVLLDEFRPWNDATTWDNGIPDDMDDVLIPVDAAVLMDGACEAATVENQGQLMAAEQNGSLETRWVLVRNGGYLRVGTEADPFDHDFQLTLIGADTGEAIMSMGTKFLAAMTGGIIDMHGTPKLSWTKLASISGQNNDIITVDDMTGWQDGDEIVLAYTGWMFPNLQPYANARSQQRSIQIDPVSGQILLNQGVNPNHFCTVSAQTYPVDPAMQTSVGKTWQLDQRAEVGVLSHNVRIVGDVPNGSTFGGHVMIMGNAAGEHGRAYLSNIELEHLGQQAKIARYPMHWHMQVDNGAGQYLRDCSIHHSFNRAITLHGTNYATAEGNVCFDQLGHAVFLEDGVEQHNVIKRNLVIRTRRPLAGQNVLLTDLGPDETQNRAPGVFWISHPNNHVTENVAAESLGTGYWFALHSEPTGVSASPTWQSTFAGINATLAPLGSFDKNVAHSCKSAFDVNDSLRDEPVLSQGIHTTPEDPQDDYIWKNRSWDPPTPTELTRMTVYGCPTGLYAGLGTGNKYTDLVTFRDCVLADNGSGFQFACGFKLADSLIVHDTRNGILGSVSGGTFAGHAQVMYDGPSQMVDCHLVGFDGSAGMGMFYDNFGAARRHPNNLVRGLTFEGGALPRVNYNVYPNQNSAFNTPGVWGLVIYDEDGSISGGLLPDHSLITMHPMVHLPFVAGNSNDILVGNGDHAWLSPRHFGHLQIFHYSGLQLLTKTTLPSGTYTRRAVAGWPAETYTAGEGGPQIRQLPVIVTRAGETGPAFTYDVEVRNHSTRPINRCDIAIDDRAVGDVTLLEVTYAPTPNQPLTTWNPSVYQNDAGTGSQSQWVPISAGGTDPTVTSYTISNGVISLRMVNTGRTHRLTFQW
ncbi:MAG: G8 domain-containing protein [Planctomycetota bacterium]